ncbi:hypothetical protein [Yersinia intermedia]|uniref:hypothetical protein n=1 Tax=Yersinia intermedia TaxID=631 RepID=UPI00065D7868|nr:hypothetical protein [Yersinia intermedia]CRY84175.1 Uncharacterised protein [Yersinia intermedia]
MKMTTHIIDGKSYNFRTKDNKTELVIKAKTTPKQDKVAHNVDVPPFIVVTRSNGDILFILKCKDEDIFQIITAQTLYDKYKFQWFEPLADNYRELLYVNKSEEVKSAYRVFTWDDIEKFAVVPRMSLMYYNKFPGDWKQNPVGGAKFLLTLIDEIPYWCDAVGQIPFAVNTYRQQRSVESTVDTGSTWATGTFSDVVMGNNDVSNTYDNFFVLRGALFAKNKFSYQITPSGKSYPAAEIKEIEHEYPSSNLGKSITLAELEKYGTWNK